MKRLIAVLLALSMAFYVAPLNAIAATNDSFSQTITVNSQPDADLVQAIASDPFLTQANPASQEQNATVDTSNVSMEATNSFGKLLLNGMDEENGSNFSSDNRIISVTLNGKTATVKYLVEEDADLVVGIYADDAEEQMVASGTVAVTKTTDGTATVAITGDIPEYYVIKGYLFDKAEHAPLCDAFVDTVGTKAHVDVENATVDDFPEERVVNLDTDNKTNFIVVNNKVELVKNEGDLLGKNEVSSYDTSNEVYIISNASEEIRSLKAGQILVYEYEEGNLLVVRPEQVEVNGDTVTIYGDKNLELMDAFEMIKIDVSADTDDLVYEGEEYQESDDDPNIEDWNSVEETNAWQGEGHPRSNPIPLKVKAAEKNGIAVSLTGKMTIDTDFAYYATLEYQFAQMVTTTHITEGQLVVEAGNKPLNKDDVVQKELHGLTFPFPWGALKITPVIEIGVAGKGTINFDSTVIKGTEYIHRGLFEFEKHELGKEPEFDIKSANVTGELSAGVSFKTEACAVGMFDVYLVEVGLQLRFTWTGVFSPNILNSAGDTEDSIHLCKVCIEVTPKAKIDMGFVGKFFDSDKLAFEIMWPIVETTGDEKYISVTYKEIGFGECPHRLYRVDITFDGDNGEGHQVYGVNHRLLGNLDGKMLLGTLDSVGKTKAYLAPASGYEVSTTINGTEYRSDTFTVGHEPTSVSFGPGKPVASGKCGDNLTWKVTDNGLMTVEGTGDMYDYGYSVIENTVPPWYYQKISKLQIGDGVTSIGACAFRNLGLSGEITLPESVEKIGDYAFCLNSSLEKVVMGSKVTYIGNSAFTWCQNLTEINIPDSVTEIGESAFSLCMKLENIHVPNSITMLNKSVFSNCSSLEEIDIPTSVTSIGEGAFGGTGLKNVKIPASVKDIGKQAFYGCTKLESIELPVGLESIGEMTFNNCTSLKKLRIPSTVKEIGTGHSLIEGCDNLTEIQIDDGITTLGWNVFMNCDGLKSVVIPASVKMIGETAFANCKNLSTVKMSAGLEKIYDGTFMNCASLTNIELPDTVSYIGASTFSHTGLTSIELPESMTYIGAGAFEDTKLTSVKIPSGVTTIYNDTFFECLDLKNVTIPISVTWIRNNAFPSNNKLTVTYEGTKEQFKAILEPWFSGDMYGVIHCSDGDIVENEENSITTGKTSTSGSTLHAVFNGLTAGEDYAVIVSKSSTNPFDANDLIYINQKTAGTGGVLDVPFTSNESGAAYVVACRRGDETQVKTKYKVTLKDYGGTSDGDVSKEYEVGATVRATYKMDPLDGRTFKCWRVVEGDITIENPESKVITFTMPAHDVVIEVVYNPAKPSTKPSDSSSSSTTTKQDDGGGAIIAVVLIGGAAIAAVTAGVILMMPVEVSGVAQLGDGNVLANAEVQLMKDGQQVAQTTTDESGHFAMEVKRGEYQLNVITTNPETGEQVVRTTSIKAPAKNTSFVF